MDFVFTGDRVFTFTPDNFETPYCFSTTIVDDSIFEPPKEYFLLNLTSNDEDVFVKDGLHQVIICDDDSKLAP